MRARGAGVYDATLSMRGWAEHAIAWSGGADVQAGETRCRTRGDLGCDLGAT